MTRNQTLFGLILFALSFMALPIAEASLDPNYNFIELNENQANSQEILQQVLHDKYDLGWMLIFGDSPKAKEMANFVRNMPAPAFITVIHTVWIKDTSVLTGEQLAQWGVSDRNYATLLSVDIHDDTIAEEPVVSGKVGDVKYVAWTLSTCALKALGGTRIDSNTNEFCHTGE